MPNIKLTADEHEFITLIRKLTPDKLERFATELEDACERGQFQDSGAISELCAYARDKARRLRTADKVRELCKGTELEGVDPEELIHDIEKCMFKGAVR